VPQNGEVNEQFGTYRSICCGAEIVINSGARFPGCPNHPQLSTIWKPSVEEKTLTETGSTPAFFHEVHVENRRLFNFAAGSLWLKEWERQHLHECSVCQAVLAVFVRQPINNPSERPAKPEDAA
jgi:hypothetical protein